MKIALPILGGLFVLLPGIASAAEPGVTSSPPCCRVAIDAGPLTARSLYQIEGSFTDDSARIFSAGSLRGRPVVLGMFFASCGYACPLTVSDMLTLQDRLPADVRNRVVFVLVSFDIERDTSAALAAYRRQRGLDGQWILLRGTNDSVRELAALLGVKYKREADGSFAHSNLFTVLNPEGEIVHQRIGLHGGLGEAVAAVVAAAKPIDGPSRPSRTP